MAVNWPSTLPQNILADGFSETPQSGLIYAEMDAGYPKVRRRFTSIIKTLNITMILTKEQKTTFENFFYNPSYHSTVPGISGGAVRVNFPDPTWYPGEGEDEDDRPLVEYRWYSESQPYTLVPDGIDWRLSFVLQRMPS